MKVLAYSVLNQGPREDKVKQRKEDEALVDNETWSRRELMDESLLSEPDIF
ncbi:hypothetical protein BY996DRAFT_6510895 [Phakopsora pachyrhizi]|uniref:Uncharacterized protein n=1 Tax=Phakopsora pachyrhizi TaxID=170000 RepID=A0AAV0BBB8_PHAPC|nr:hypothetical protein BY996DRAFT_6510895 [Phakopsora pachyrhizi]CAH7684401.1 hypothetical protein PPACK8108_LOCUS18579 [Phakopsora pachyrhizi]